MFLNNAYCAYCALDGIYKSVGFCFFDAGLFFVLASTYGDGCVIAIIEFDINALYVIV